jgi:hypothetical protein
LEALVTGSLSKSTLKGFLDAVVERSASLQYGAFTLARIARTVFPQASRKLERDNARSRLWECYSPRHPRPLKAVHLQAILNACRNLLREQYQSPALRNRNADRELTEFERDLCKRLGFKNSGRATVDDFRLDERVEHAATPAEFGIPDVVEWREGSFDFAARLKATQSHSIETLEELVPRIASTDNDEKRLRLLQVALSISALNHPGTRFHDRAFELALVAADSAQLLRLVYGPRTPDPLRRVATRMLYHLHFNRFLPTLDSPTNYARYALQGKRLPDAVWHQVRGSLEQAILDARRLVEIDPENHEAIRFRSAVLSMKARFLAVRGDAAAWREADALHRESLEEVDRIPQPYGFAYPILKDIVRSRIDSAIRRSVEATRILEDAGGHASAAAFAALFLQLTQRKREASADKQFRELAMKALSSVSIQYQCSHVFDAQALKAILSKNGRAKDQRRTQARKKIS